MIRRMKMGDIPRVVEIMGETLDRSDYRGRVEINQKAAKSLLMAAITRHGKRQAEGMFAAVATTEDVVEGYIIGTLQPFYFVTDKLEASDLQWVTTPRAGAKDAINLMLMFHAWAKACPDVIEIRQANVDTISDPEAVSRLLEARAGMTRCGHVLRKELTP